MSVALVNNAGQANGQNSKPMNACIFRVLLGIMTAIRLHKLILDLQLLVFEFREIYIDWNQTLYDIPYSLMEVQ